MLKTANVSQNKMALIESPQFSVEANAMNGVGDGQEATCLSPEAEG
jgi:hypothetical protein